jgi:septum formation protein
MRFLLASASPRRRELLRRAGFDFDVQPSHIVEEIQRGERPEEFARRVAREKAMHVAASSPPGSFVLGADTVVVIDGETLGKPSDPSDATRMLRLLSGRTHQVHTGICLVRAPDEIVALKHETTLVTFRELDEEEIRSYVESGEPLDKAGAYAIQGLTSKFVTRISGCYSNVVGLPVALVCEILKPILKKSRRHERIDPLTPGPSPPRGRGEKVITQTPALSPLGDRVAHDPDALHRDAGRVRGSHARRRRNPLRG